jgi:hypothetical protein
MIHAMRLLKISAAVAVALVVLAWSQDAPPRAGAILNDSDGDGVIDVAEIVSGSDPHNAQSTPESTEASFASGLPLCADGRDNDLDGLTDANDPSCTDSDNDIISNTTETLLGSDPHNAASFPEDSRFDAAAAFAGYPLHWCGDHVDNDGDGLIDSADPGCTPISNDGDAFDDGTEKLFGSDPANPNSVPEHEIPNPGSCSDGIDNDLDGLTDSADPGCQPATNDAFANATAISALPYSDVEKITSATSEPTDPASSCFGTPPENVWYRYTAGVDGVLVADTAGTTGSNVQTLLSAWTDRNGRLVEVACAYGGFGSAQQTRVAFHAVAGETYYILVGGLFSPQAPANLSFHLTTGTPPANDDFFSAAPISALPFTGAADTSDATTEFNEPGCIYGRPVSTVWYRFAPGQDTLVLADASPSDFPAVIGVWTPTTFGLAQIACSVNAYNGQMSERVAFKAHAGQTYYLQAGGLFTGPSAGSLSLALQVGIPPANDDFAGATAVTSLPFTDTVDALTATGELGEPAPSCVYGSPITQTIWYRYTATSDQYVEAGTDNTFRGDLIVAAYQGDSLSNLREVACAQPYPPSNRAAFHVVAGQTYYILVAGQTYGYGCCKSVSGESGSPVPIPPPIPSPPLPGSPTPPPPSSMVTFHMDTLSVPTCAPPTFAYADPVGDALGFLGPPPPGHQSPDITSVAGGDDGQNVCLDIQFAAPLPAPNAGGGSPTIIVNFDSDELPGQTMSCFDGTGTDLNVYVPVPSNLIVPLYPNFPVPNPPPQGLVGYAVFGESSLRLIIPLAALGGDDSFRVTTMVNGPDGFDCAPDTGAIQSPLPPLPGDANCDGQTNSLDSLLILQLFANLIGSLPCQYAGDVNHNGGVGPIDAVLILQYSSGMLSAFAAQ